MTTEIIGPCECCGSSSSTSSSTTTTTPPSSTTTGTTGTGEGCCPSLIGVGTAEIANGGTCNQEAQNLIGDPSPGPATTVFTIGSDPFTFPILLSVSISCTGDTAADWSLTYSFSSCTSGGGTVTADSIVIDYPSGPENPCTVEVIFTIDIDENDCCNGTGGGSTAQIVVTFT